MQWACNMCEAFDEWAVKIKESYYFPHFHDVFGCWPCVNSHNFYWVHACHPLFKNYPQVIYGWCMECAFLWFEIQVMFLHNVKDITHHSHMILLICSCGDPNVIHIHVNHHSQWFMFGDGVVVDVVHHGLECHRQVHEPKYIPLVHKAHSVS